MKILLIHNKYKQPGGEDAVFYAERDLLLRNNREVECLIYDNSSINGWFDRLLTGIRAIYNPNSVHQIKNKILEFNPDVIHVHNFFPLVSPSIFFAADRLDVPVILTLHNYRLICPSATMFYDGAIYEKSIRHVFPFDAVWKGVYRNSRLETAVVALMTATHNLIGTWKSKIDGYIALTEFSKKQFAASTLSISPGKFFVKSNFVENRGLGNQVRENFFLFIGRLTEEKGIHILLKAVGLRKFRLLIIGDGPLRKVVEESVHKEPNIQYLGLQNKEMVISYLKRCKALIFPSIWYEGFPITILEAFSTGTPVIASRLGGMEEIIQDHENGLHFEPGNAPDLVSKIDELSKDQALVQFLGQGARQSYLELYTPEKNYLELIKIYARAIEQRQGNFNFQATLEPQLVQ